MGFYLRKSVRVGPFRFNLSKSGIGVSAGIPGFRLGAGPRGNYIHLGRHGLYYRATIPSAAKPRKPRPTTDQAAPSERSTLEEHLRAIESADVSQMQDSSSESLLTEFDQKRRRIRRSWVVAVLCGIVIIGLLVGQAPHWVTLATLVLVLLAIILARIHDKLKKTVVLLYTLEPEVERDYQALHDGFAALRECAGCWHVEAEGDLQDRKRNAGASRVLGRRPIYLSNAAPPFVRTNIAVPRVPVGRQTLYFFPDRILVFDPKGVGAIGYSNMRVERSGSRCIVENAVPPDATIIDRTWQYVNKSGSPDRRFKENRELPIVLYEDLHLKSDNGLNELLQFSKADVAAQFETAILNLARNQQPTPVTSPTPRG